MYAQPSRVSRKALSVTVAALALLAAAGLQPARADEAIEVEDSSTNVVEATQHLTGQISGSDATTTNDSADDVEYRNGDVDYDSNTFNAPGVYTLQNQTGQNNAGNNGTNIAAQVNVDQSGGSLEVEDGSSNRVHAHQTMESSITDGSDSTVTNTTTGGVGFFGGGDTASSRTGDVSYDSTTFNAPGVYTLQNNTGNNVAANNASQIAAQLNDDTVEISDNSSNKILAHQSLTAMISGSNSTVYNASVTGDVFSRTGDVTYASTTFDAPGVYALSNNTGLNNAGNNASNISAQLNGQSAVDALASVFAP